MAYSTTFTKAPYTGEIMQMNDEIEKSRVQVLIELVEYAPHSVVSKTIIRKTTGNVTVIAIDTEEKLIEKISPFDTFIQIIDGSAEVVIEQKKNRLEAGDAIVVPAHTAHFITAKTRFKMIATIIKSGYEESTTAI